MKQKRIGLSGSLLTSLLMISCASCASIRPSGGYAFEAPVMRGPIQQRKCQISLTPNGDETKNESPKYTSCVLMLREDFDRILLSLIHTCKQAGFSDKVCTGAK